MTYDSTQDTRQHIAHVADRLHRFANELRYRAELHDASKLLPPEKEAYDLLTSRLKDLTYGSEEYRATLRELQPAITHHYQANSHHPEHYPEGIDGMDLLDLVEMFCDWKAASLRHKDGNFEKSLRLNQDRFGISDQLLHILLNSLPLVEAGAGEDE